MNEISERAKQATESLSEAVAKVLERKRLLGQYAVMDKNGKPIKVPASELGKPNHSN